MSKVLKVVGFVAGAIAIVATAGAALAGVGLFLGMTAGTLTTIATIASVAAGVASIGISLIGARPPPARGSVARIMVEPNAPRPYVMGKAYTGGILRHQAGYGATLNDVPNPYMGMVIVYSGHGPVQSITPKFDYGTIGSYYSGFAYTDTQLGAVPEAGPLTANFATFPNWTSSYRLSGNAAILWNFKFDKDGKIFASGLPLLGAVVEGVKVYDPRLDSTYPGGSGSHRLNNEATWTYSRNPALHAAAYAYGRYQNNKLVFGIDLPSTAIVWSDVVSWANTCDANAWTVNGTIYEGGDDATRQRWANLTEICLAGGAEPVFANGMLGFRWSSPKTPLDEITDADILTEDASVTVMQPWRERINTAIPQYRSETHNWEIVSAEAVEVSTYVTEDGEEKVETWPFNLVTDKDQAAELATYRIVDKRELAPITITVKPRLRWLRPGDCITLNSNTLDIDSDCVVLHRELDPASMQVTLTLMSETGAKHGYALGLTAIPPPTPVLQMSGEDRDEVGGTAQAGWKTNLVYKKAATKPSTPSPSPGVPSTWFDDALSATGGDLPLWESFGVKPVGEPNFTWSSPAAAVIDSRIWDGVDNGGGIKPGQVDTGAVVVDAISERPYAYAGTSKALSTTPQLLLDMALSADVAGKDQMFSGLIDCTGATFVGDFTSPKITVRRCNWANSADYSVIMNDRMLATLSEAGVAAGFAPPFMFRDTPDSTYRRYQVWVSLVDSSTVTATTESFVASMALKR